MKIEITDSASKWFQEEMGLGAGNGVRFYGKVYGKTPVHEGFSLALTRDDHPVRPMPKLKKMALLTLWTKGTVGSSSDLISKLILILRKTQPTLSIVTRQMMN